MEWIKRQLDSIFGLGPVLVIIVLGLVLVAIPTAIALAYVVQRRRSGLPRQ